MTLITLLDRGEHADPSDDTIRSVLTGFVHAQVKPVSRRGGFVVWSVTAHIDAVKAACAHYLDDHGIWWEAEKA